MAPGRGVALPWPREDFKAAARRLVAARSSAWDANLCLPGAWGPARVGVGGLGGMVGDVGGSFFLGAPRIVWFSLETSKQKG